MFTRNPPHVLVPCCGRTVSDLSRAQSCHREQAILHRVAQNACESLFVDLVLRQVFQRLAARNVVGSNVLGGRTGLNTTLAPSSACGARRRTQQLQIRTPFGYARRRGSWRAPSRAVSSAEPLAGCKLQLGPVCKLQLGPVCKLQLGPVCKLQLGPV